MADGIRALFAEGRLNLLAGKGTEVSGVKIAGAIIGLVLLVAAMEAMFRKR